MKTQSFRELQLMEPILRAIDEQGYDTPTPIQSQAIPLLLDGNDLLGIAQTGTGKTAAFALPMLDFLIRHHAPRRSRQPRALVLTPTRELATQIGDSFATYGKHLSTKHTVIFGGVGQGKQVRALRAGVDVLVATPGRLLDLMQQGQVDLRSVELFVLDEADRMLDMGFLPAVKKVIGRLPHERQTLLFSATMPKDIVSLARSILRDPLKVEVTPPATTVERIDQSVMYVQKHEKRDLLDHVLSDLTIDRVLVFTRTKHGADRVVRHLHKSGQKAEAIHGNKSQGARERALDGFRSGRLRVLVATDIAARGIDVRDITHVINFDLPNEPESYVHRIGRTARAGRDGTAISFCDGEERAYLRAIEKTTGTKIPVIHDHPFPAKRTASRDDDARRTDRRSKPGSKSRRPRPGSRPGSRSNNGSKRNAKPTNRRSNSKRSGGGRRGRPSTR